MRRKTFQEPSNKAPLKGRGDEAGEGRSEKGGEITPLHRASERAKKAESTAAAAAGEERQGEVRQSAGENEGDSGGRDKSRVT